MTSTPGKENVSLEATVAGAERPAFIGRSTGKRKCWTASHVGGRYQPWGKSTMNVLIKQCSTACWHALGSSAERPAR